MSEIGMSGFSGHIEKTDLKTEGLKTPAVQKQPTPSQEVKEDNFSRQIKSGKFSGLISLVENTAPADNTRVASKPVPIFKEGQEKYVVTHKLYDFKTNTWNSGNFKPLENTEPRFAGINQPNGPKFPREALVNPDKYTVDAFKKQKDPKNIDYYVGKVSQPIVQKYFFPGGGPDEIPNMPVEMVRNLETYLQPGDIILQGSNVDLDKKGRGIMMHGLIYMGKDPDGKGIVIHSIGVKKETAEGTLKPGVFISTWENAIQRDVGGADRLQVLRSPNMTQKDFNKIAGFALQEVGKTYDFTFNTKNSDRYYCTELVYKALQKMENPPKLNRDPRTLNVAVTGPSFQEAGQNGELQTVLILNPEEESNFYKK